MNDQALQDWMERKDEARRIAEEREIFGPDGGLKRDVTMSPETKAPAALKTIVKDAVKEAFVKFKRNSPRGEILNPTAARCHVIARFLNKGLELNDSVDVELVYKGHRIALRNGESATGHSYIKVRLKGGDWFLVDPMYLQFVSEEDRVGLPDVMMIPLDDEISVDRALFAHKISDTLYHVWMGG